MLYKAEAGTRGGVRRFLVAWRNTARRRISPVGVLQQHELDEFVFWYLPTAATVDDFRPFLGFPDITRVYRSSMLWPFFSVRVMDARRPDYAAYIAAHGLEPGASQLDILSRTGGERKGDSVQVIEEPTIGKGGATSCIFLVRGARYATAAHRSNERAEALEVGEQVTLRKDSENPVNPEALMVTTADGAPLGWVPDVLIAYADTVRRSVGWKLTVLKNNGPSVPWHMRLLVQLEGLVSVDYQPFAFAGVAEPAAPVAT